MQKCNRPGAIIRHPLCLLALLTSLCIGGCGQKGDLTLRQSEPVDSQSEDITESPSDEDDNSQ